MILTTGVFFTLWFARKLQEMLIVLLILAATIVKQCKLCFDGVSPDHRAASYFRL